MSNKDADTRKESNLNRDSGQKDLLCKHFAARGWFVQPEVVVVHRGGADESKDITDIDVFALRPSEDLRWEVVLGDCKTLKNQSPANRVMWLRGLMSYFHATAGIIVLRRSFIESDHKLLAAANCIQLLSEDEFDRFDRAILYPEGSSVSAVSLSAINSLRDSAIRYQALTELTKFTNGLAWNEPNRIDLIRKAIGETVAIAREIDPSKREHVALVLNAASVFAVGLAECVGTVFNQYLQPNTKDLLDDALKVVIWGGRSQYDFVAKLRSEVLSAKRIEVGPEGPLALPEWATFVQLVRNMLECPRLSFAVAPMLRQSALNVSQDTQFLQTTQPVELPQLRLAMLAASYFCKATKMPAQMRRLLEDLFAKRQSDLVHTTPSAASAAESISSRVQTPLFITEEYGVATSSNETSVGSS